MPAKSQLNRQPPLRGVRLQDEKRAIHVAGAEAGTRRRAKRRRTRDAPVAIVGVGAPAGAFGTVQEFFGALPADSRMAFILLSGVESNPLVLTVDFISRATSLKVTEIADRMRVRANTVYVAPPSRRLTIRGGQFRLSGSVTRGTASIDTFLRSLAEDQQERAIAVLLSAADAQGTPGLMAVRACGGMALVQAPPPGPLPSSAAASFADHLLPVPEMPAALSAYAGSLRQRPAAGRKSKERAADQVNQVVTVLRTRKWGDFRGYDPDLLRRRIERRKRLLYCQNGDYLHLLRGSPDEARQLVSDLLIKTTRFFRDPKAFQALEEQVLAPLVRDKRSDEEVRVWVPRCATGEEAYSIAMLILEQLEARKKSCPVRVFASDTDEELLDVARRGTYSEAVTEDIPAARRARFFTRCDDGSLKVKPELRDSVTFAVQNLLCDAPFAKLDLVSCQDVLSALNSEARSRAISALHYALKPQGALWLGPADAIEAGSELFHPISAKWRIYRRIGQLRPHQIELPTLRRHRPAPIDQDGASGKLSPGELTVRALLEEFAPSALLVLVNRRHEILYSVGPTSRYLQLPTGRPTRDLLALVQDGIQFKLRPALKAASEKGERIVVEDLLVRNEQGSDEQGGEEPDWRNVKVTVIPVRAPREASGLFLVTFEEGARGPVAPPAGLPAAPEEETLVRQLHRELEATRDELQETIKDLETLNEEQKASNEEVLSMNEELQSANEELETSQEELQSANEELATINSQLQEKIFELERTNNDIANFLNCTDLPTLFLDRELRIKRFTPSAIRMFRLVPGDVGRPVGDIAQRFADPELLADAAQVLADLAPREAAVQTEAGGWSLRRIMPYRTTDNHIDGVVATFVDVTELKHVQRRLQEFNEMLEGRVAERAAQLKDANATLEQKIVEREKMEVSLRESRERLRALVDSAADAVITFDESGVIESVNPAAERMFQYPSAQMLGRNLKMLLSTGSGRARNYVAADLKTKFRQAVGTSREVEGKRGDGTRFPMELAVGEISHLRLFTGILHDASRRKELERDVVDVASMEQRRIGQDLHDSVGQDLTALRMMAKDLAESLAADGSQAAELAEKIASGLQRALQEVRDVTRGLNPVPAEPDGLMSALSDLVDRVRQQSRVACRFECPEPVRLDDNVAATQLYRIAQEALANALKHGQARRIDVSLRRENGAIAVQVQDDGRGIKAPPRADRGFGLRIMQNRAAVIGAKLGFLPGTPTGTIVTCLLPQKKHDQNRKKTKPPRQSPHRR